MIKLFHSDQFKQSLGNKLQNSETFQPDIGTFLRQFTPSPFDAKHVATRNDLHVTTAGYLSQLYPWSAGPRLILDLIE